MSIDEVTNDDISQIPKAEDNFSQIPDEFEELSDLSDDGRAKDLGERFKNQFKK